MAKELVLKQNNGGYNLLFLNKHKYLKIKYTNKSVIKNSLSSILNKYSIKDKANDILKRSRKGSLDVLDIAITGQCNLSCRHCYWGNKNIAYKDLPFVKLKHIFLDAKKLGAHTVALTGGEPFMHKDIGKILAFLNKERFRIVIVTNGTLINDYINIIKKYKPHTVVVSLDGFKHEFEQIRGTNWENVVNNILLLKQAGIYVRINCVLSESISNQIKKFKDFCLNQLKVDRVAFLPVAFRGSASKNKDIFIKYKQVTEAICNEYSSDIMNCRPFYNKVSIGFDGLVYPCQFFREIDFYRLGNINENSLIRIYKLIQSSGLMPAETSIKCKNCKHLNICGGGCWGRAVAILNNPNAPDPVWCDLFNGKESNSMLLPEANNPLYSALSKDYITAYEKPQLLYDKATNLIKELHPKSILDIGCGDGSFLKQLKGNDKRKGIDSSKELILEAKKYSKGAIFEIADIRYAVFHKKYELATAIYSFFNHFQNRTDIELIFDKIKYVSEYFLFDAIEPKKFPPVSAIKHESNKFCMHQFVYRDNQAVYDLRKYIKGKKELFYALSFPIINWEHFFKEHKFIVLTKERISKTRVLYLLKL
ncbi:MAG: radical SAM protein [Candidatus Nanoarchaeia archaeon]|nr:radical SAM protein [Candidatus Nanoarchaeia archaeon]